MARITRKETQMLEAANRYLKQHEIKDIENEAYLMAETMAMETEAFTGYSFYGGDGKKTSRDLATYVQLNTRV